MRQLQYMRRMTLAPFVGMGLLVSSSSWAGEASFDVGSVLSSLELKPADARAVVAFPTGMPLGTWQSGQMDEVIPGAIGVQLKEGFNVRTERGFKIVQTRSLLGPVTTEFQECEGRANCRTLTEEVPAGMTPDQIADPIRERFWRLDGNLWQVQITKPFCSKNQCEVFYPSWVVQRLVQNPALNSARLPDSWVAMQFVGSVLVFDASLGEVVFRISLDSSEDALNNLGQLIGARMEPSGRLVLKFVHGVLLADLQGDRLYSIRGRDIYASRKSLVQVLSDSSFERIWSRSGASSDQAPILDVSDFALVWQDQLIRIRFDASGMRLGAEERISPPAVDSARVNQQEIALLVLTEGSDASTLIEVRHLRADQDDVRVGLSYPLPEPLRDGVLGLLDVRPVVRIEQGIYLLGAEASPKIELGVAPTSQLSFGGGSIRVLEQGTDNCRWQIFRLPVHADAAGSDFSKSLVPAGINAECSVLQHQNDGPGFVSWAGFDGKSLRTNIVEIR
jgi:hypothetical protein